MPRSQAVIGQKRTLQTPRSPLEIEVSPSRKGAQITPPSAEPCIGIGGMPIMHNA